jgi:hypothetical protein
MKITHPSLSSSSLLAAALAVSSCGSEAAVDTAAGGDEAALVADDADTATDGLVRCRVDEGDDGVLDLGDLSSFVLATMDECALLDGMVADLPLPPTTATFAAGPGQSLPVPLATKSVPPWVLKVITDSGIPKRRYVPTDYDCDDFASDAEKELERKQKGLGTFTVLFCSTLRDGLVNPESEDYLPHAITDVHLEGKTGWLEPQTGKEVSLDLDGNGGVYVRDGAFSASEVFRPTERSSDGRFGCSVYVYADRASAERNGWKLD